VHDEHRSCGQLGVGHPEGVVHLRQHRPVRADHRWLLALDEPVHPALDGPGRGAFLGQLGGHLDVERGHVGVRADRPPAPQAARAEHPVHAVRREHGHHLLRLHLALRRQRPLAVVADPRLARLGLPVSEHDDRVRLLADPGELVEGLPVAPVGQQVGGLVERHPGDVVDLGVGAVV
jgi:hypothetical protein